MLVLHGPEAPVEKLPAVELEVTVMVTDAPEGCESCRLIGADEPPAVSVCDEVANDNAGWAVQR